jgi:very-short-patch-repair endonuclease
MGRRTRELVAAVVQQQRGVVARRQLLACGVSRDAIAGQLRRGELVPLHRGVYAVGHGWLVPDARVIAAALACGPTAVASHRTAADLHDLRNSTHSRPSMAVARGRSKPIPGVDVHRRTLLPDEITTVRGIRVTTVARTLVDLAAVEPPHRIARLVDRAIELDRYDQRALDAQFARPRPGTGALRRILHDRDPDSHRLKLELEHAMHALIRAHDLPRPEVNAWLPEHNLSPDLLWRGHRLVVELDGRRFHTAPTAFEGDRRKTADLQAAGYTVRRFTWRQVTTDPDWVVGHLRQALTAR